MENEINDLLLKKQELIDDINALQGKRDDIAFYIEQNQKVLENLNKNIESHA